MIKDKVPPNIYSLFLMLYSSMTLLLSPDLNSHRVAVARRIIYRFVENFVVVYGIVLLTYKLHSLIHIADDCDF